MRAVVLVGGFGTRLRPLTTDVPKQMLPVVHVSMLERVIAGLARYGVDEAVLSLGFRPDAFIDAYPSGELAGVRLRYAVEPEPLDTAGAIRFAALEAGIDETFVVVNGDVLNDFDLRSLLELHRARGAEGTIHLTPVDDPSRYGVVPTADDGRVLGFIEKPPRDEAPTNWINAGTYILEPSVLARIPAGRKVSIERETFPAMVADGTLYALGDACYWIDAGTPATYLEVQLDLLGSQRGVPEQGVHADASIDPTAQVVRSVVAAGARIDAGAQVRDSVVLGDAHICADAQLDHAIVAEHAHVGAGAVLNDHCVIGRGQRIAPGTKLTNAKVPEGS
jgi:mannose-1-phosphate guanylyltransferase